MTLQTVVRDKQAFGNVGAFYDDSPRRVAPYLVKANPSTAVAAEGVITLGANPTANDTVTVADKTYKFVSALAAANDVKIGTNAAGTIANLTAAINGGEGAGSTYGTGTTANDFVTAEAGSGKVDLTVKTAGAAGNAVGLSSAFTSSSNTITAFSGGADAGAKATIGTAFTLDASDPTIANVGGTGVFGGILVNAHEYVKEGLGATIELDEPTTAQLCTMGHVIVKAENAVEVGNYCFYNNTTGALKAASSTSSIAGYTLIANAKFIFVAAAQGELSVLELT